MNSRGRVILLVAVLTSSSGAFAAPSPRIPVDGRAVGPDGQALAGAQVEIRPVESSYEEGVREADDTAREGPPAVAGVTRKDGRFSLAVPEAGLWTMTVRATGYVPVAMVSPLLEATVLPDAALARDAGLRVRVEGSDGRPLPGAQVRAAGREDPGMTPWQPLPRHARTGSDGQARLARAADETLQVWALATGYAVAEAPGSTNTAVTLRLHRDAPRRVLFHELSGAPGPGLIVRDPQSGLVLGHFLPGRQEAHLATGGRVVRIETADGRRGEQIAAAEMLLSVPALRTGHILALGPAARRPLAGAWIWPAAEPGLAVRSDSQGVYRIAGADLTGGLAAAAPGFLADSREHVAPDRRELPTLGLSPASSFDGTVVDEEGRPVAGALVLLGPRNPGYRPLCIEARGWTSAAGRFHISGFGGGFACRVEIQHADFAPLIGSVDGLPLAMPGKRIVLLRGAAVTGTVVDEQGRPAAGGAAGAVEVELVRDPSQSPESSETSLGRADVGPDGRFDIFPLAPGWYQVFVMHPGFLPGKVQTVEIPASGRTGLSIALQRGLPFSFTGRITDPQGAPLLGMDVSSISETTQDVTDADGRYRLTGVLASPPGEPQTTHLSVWAHGEAFGDAEKTVSVEPGEHTVDFVLSPREAAPPEPRGWAVDSNASNDAPLTGVEVTGSLRGLEPAEAGWARVVAAEGSGAEDPVEGLVSSDGTYHLGPLPEGVWTLRAMVADREARRDVSLTEGDREMVADLEFIPVATVSGQVTGPDGAPASYVTVYFEDEDGETVPRMTRTDGTFEIRLQNGHYKVSTRTHGFGVEEPARTLTVAGDPVSGLEIRLSAAATLRGHVFGLQPGEVPWLDAEGPGFISAAMAEPDGSFSLPFLYPGTWKVSIHVVRLNNALEVIEKTVTVHEGEMDIPLDVTFSAEPAP